MKKVPVAFLCLLFLLASARAQSLPKAGSPAPALAYTQLFQAPKDTKANWRALRGKVVVLEFWATWCAPCVAEIPVLNRLANSLPSSEVQFISVDDEAPAVVQPFLKKNPIAGWVMLDTTSTVFNRFGVLVRPTTIVVDAKGKVVSTDVPPDRLRREGLLRLAEGKPAVIEGKADAKVEKELQATQTKLIAEQKGENDEAAKPLFNLSIVPGDAQKDTHVFLGVPGVLDVMDADPRTLLMFALGMSPDRIKVDGKLGKVVYSLHVHAPGVNAIELAQAVEFAIQSACGVKVEQHTAVQDVYLLQTRDKTGGLLNFSPSSSDSHGGFAFYDVKKKQMHFMNASTEQVAQGLESSLHVPVIDESGVSGSFMANFSVPPHDFASTKSALEKNTGLTLASAKRPVEEITLTPEPPSAKTNAKPAQ